MISLPFRRFRRDPRIEAFYGMIVAQARSTTFYRGYGVPDTVEGRLEMIMLHLALALGPSARAQDARRLFDRFCRDIDDNLREMGVGDLAVPKQMKRVAEAFYGRAKVYEAALVAGDLAALEAVVARNVFGATAASDGARGLAIYMRQAALRLSRQDLDALPPVALDFPDPDTYAPRALQPERTR